LSAWTITSSPGFRSRPFETRLFDSLVLRVMTISSGVTRRNAASALRVSSFSGISRARLTGDGSASTVCVSLVSTSTTGRDAGQRLAAFMTERSGGITNCARTLFQNTSPPAAPPAASGGGVVDWRAQVRSAKSAAEPPSANTCAKCRLETGGVMSVSPVL
jgi:hypothetical protein